MPPRIRSPPNNPKTGEFTDPEQCGDETTALLSPPIQASSPPVSTELQGYLLMAVSCVGFTAMSTFVHIAEQKFNFPVVITLFIRGFIQATLTFLYIAVFLPFPDTFSSLSKKQVKLLALRSLSGSVSLVFYFASLQKLPLGEAITIFFCSPVIVMILSNVFLAEPITFIDSIAAVICFIGVFLVARPEEIGVSSAVSRHDRIIGSLYSVISAFLSAVADVTVRGLGTSIHYMVSVFSFTFILTIQTSLMGVAMPPAEPGSLRMEGALSALIAALISLPALGCLNRAFQLCRAGPGSMIRNLDIPFSYILGVVFLNEPLTLLRLLGSVLVVSGTLMIGLRQVLQS